MYCMDILNYKYTNRKNSDKKQLGTLTSVYQKTLTV